MQIEFPCTSTDLIITTVVYKGVVNYLYIINIQIWNLCIERILEDSQLIVKNINRLSSSRIIYKRTVVRKYGFYVRMTSTICHEWAQRTSEILLFPQEHKTYIFELPCIVLFTIWSLELHVEVVLINLVWCKHYNWLASNLYDVKWKIW